MTRENLEIRKGGLLIETKWIYDEEVDKGEYQEFDRTDSAIRFMFEDCGLAKDVILKDVLLLINTELDIFDAMIGNWCKELVTEGLTKPDKPYTGYDPDEIEYLELAIAAYREEDMFYGYNRLDFGGRGFLLQEDKNCDGYVQQKGTRINYGIGYSPVSDIVNIPLKLDTNFNVYNEDVNTKNYGTKLCTFKGGTTTLGIIIHSIIWELSYHGGPKKRDEFAKGLRDSYEEITNNPPSTK